MYAGMIGLFVRRRSRCRSASWRSPSATSARTTPSLPGAHDALLTTSSPATGRATRSTSRWSTRRSASVSSGMRRRTRARWRRSRSYRALRESRAARAEDPPDRGDLQLRPGALEPAINTLAFLHTERRDLDRALAAAGPTSPSTRTQHQPDRPQRRGEGTRTARRADQARATLLTADRLRARMGRVPPMYIANLQRSRLLLELAELRGADTRRAALARRGAPRAAPSPRQQRSPGCVGGVPPRRTPARAAAHGARAALVARGARRGQAPRRPPRGRAHAARVASALAMRTAGRVAGLDARQHRAAARDVCGLGSSTSRRSTPSCHDCLRTRLRCRGRAARLTSRDVAAVRRQLEEHAVGVAKYDGSEHHGVTGEGRGER